MSRRRNARKYLILAEQSWQIAMAYRAYFFTSLLSGVIQVLVLYYIWKVVYVAHQEISGFTSSQMVTYIFISYAVRNLYSFRTETEISSGIRDGSVVMELIKPLDYQLARFFDSLGAVVVEGILIAIMVLALGFGIFGMSMPPDPVAGLLFSASVVQSILVNFALSYIVGLLSFWTTSVFGFINTKRFISNFFSGGLVPLTFFPEWLRVVAMALPFNAIVHVPASIYLGQIRGSDAMHALLIQAVWAVALWVAGRLLWSQASKQVTIHGG